MSPLSRRRFLSSSAAAGLGLTLGRRGFPAIVAAQGARPAITHGVQAGDVAGGRAMIWSRTDRPARMVVRYATTPSLSGARVRRAAPTSAARDFTSHLDLTGLPEGQRIFYEVRFEDAGNTASEPVTGSFVTPAESRDRVTIAWGGDTAGQGWGIDASRGGMLTFESMRQLEPDLFVNSGDLIYADGPIAPQVTLADGTIWRNLVSEEVAKVAETLREFRGRYKYNLADEHVRRFNAHVPIVAQWDDHEVLDNWYPGERLGSIGGAARFTEKNVDVLAGYAAQAFHEYTPTRTTAAEPRRVHRCYRHGSLVELFVLDCRTFRSANSSNLQAAPGPDTRMFGLAQLEWLKRGLAASRAAWKLIACDQPLGVVIRDGPSAQEGFANANPALLGREHEVADLLAHLQAQRIRNVVWITADVHYAAAHEYHPSRASFTRFDPFWEFIAGPLHAGTFSPGQLDPTFGPELKFCAVPAGTAPNQPPSAGLQFFGVFTVDRKTRAATVALHDRTGRRVFQQEIAPAEA